MIPTDSYITERWEERAAVREFDGGVSKAQAEFLAVRDVRRMFGRVPDEVMRRVKAGRAETQGELFG